MTLQDRFAGHMGRLLGPDFPEHIALAVSGGGDSMAMLALSHEWARHMGVKLWVVTVDHGLRPESADEATMVAKECAALGHPHATLRWQWDGQGNLQDAARRARLDLIDRWRGGIDHVLFAHTQDDVAETFLMRLARGSGVEGLSAMADRRLVDLHSGGWSRLADQDVSQGIPPPMPSRPLDGVPTYSREFHVIRPLLSETRAELRHHITTLRVPFVDDPSNEDPTYDRARIRAAMGDLGIDAQTIAATAHRMERAGTALRSRAANVAHDLVRQDEVGTLRFDRDGFAEVERDTQLRLMAAALQWTSSSTYRPRAAATEALLEKALAGGGGTLHGAQVEVTRDQIEVFRELAAVSDHTAEAGSAQLWDKRWMLYGPPTQGMQVRALGDDGWQQITPIPDGPRHAIARTLPALFDGPTLAAFLPHRFGPVYMAEFRPPRGPFVASLLSR